MLMSQFHLTIEAAFDMPLDQAFALRDWSTSANCWLNVRRATDGYIAQERHRLLDAPELIP